MSVFKYFFLVSLCASILTGCAGITNNASDTSVVIVGMQNSKVFGPCAGCGNDVVRMKKLLAPYSKHVTVLQNGEATRANVKNALIEGSKRNLLIFYYTGHGGQNNNGDPSETDKRDEFLCLWDGMFLDNELWNIAVGANGKVMYIIDACHSATMYRSIGEQLETRSLETRGNSPSVLCWSGCRDDNESFASDNGGYFTTAITKRIKSHYTYDRAWNEIKSYPTVKPQQPQKTEIGKGWGTLVFH